MLFGSISVFIQVTLDGELGLGNEKFSYDIWRLPVFAVFVLHQVNLTAISELS